MSILKLNLSGHDNPTLAAMGFVTPKTPHVNFDDPELPQKFLHYLRSLDIDSDTTVHLAVPGSSVIAVLTIAAIHGLTGHWPVVFPLVRREDGFYPAAPLNLQQYRDRARMMRSNSIQL
ncbi:MAG: CRISPR-associated protein Csx15 [Cyanobacteria bacterium P01_E01_bin.42]